MKKNNQLTVAEYFTQQVDLCGKTQAQIAEEMGFELANVVSNIKSGRTKIPLSRIGSAAKALGIDQLFLLKMALNEYYPAEENMKGPTMWQVIEAAAGRLVTDNEYQIVTAIRELSADKNPSMRTDAAREKLAEFVKELL